MRSLQGLLGTTAIGLMLLWGTAAIAQPASPDTSRMGLSIRPLESSTTRSLICNASGDVCIAGKRQTVTPLPPTRLPKDLNTVPIAAPSHARLLTSGLKQAKQTAAIGAGAQVICDSSGQICLSTQNPAGSRASESSKMKGTDAGSGSGKSSMAAAVLPFASPKTVAGGVVNQPDSVDHAKEKRIDGMTIYYTLTNDDPFNWAVHVYKSQHRLEVYLKGHLYRTYHAVFGRSLGSGAKLWEGDRRTPEGSYLIVGKHRSARFGWFLHLNYPNEQDHERFEQRRAAHLIPATVHEGGQIGIHGTDSPYLNVAEVDWTTGCISVNNTDISELAHLLPIGTLVIINP